MSMIEFTDKALKDWNDYVKEACETVEFAEAMKKAGNKIFYVYDKKKKDNKAIIILQEPYPVLKSIASRAQIFTSSKDEKFLDALFEKLKKMKIPYARIGNTMWGFDEPVKIKNSNLITRYNFVIDLTKGEEELWKNLNKKSRNAVRKAKKEGVEIKEIKNERELNDYYKISLKTGKRIKEEKGRKAFTILSKSFFSYLYKSKIAKFVVAKYKNKIISGSLFLCFNKKILYYHSCSSPEYNKLQAPSAIQWYIIKKAKEEGYKEYDLGGCTPGLTPEDSRYFVYEFKRKWGGQLKKFYNLEIALSPTRKKIQDILIRLRYGKYE